MMSTQTRVYRPIEDLRKRIRWLILLRWIAVAGLFAVITISRFLLRLDLPFLHLYLGNAALLASNCSYALYFRKMHHRRANLVINVQISLDLLILTYLLSFSGGIANPFFLFFIFHMVIASILLSNRAAYMQATLAVCLFCLLIAGELWAFVPAGPLFSYSFSQSPETNVRYLVGLFSGFVAAIYITVYMTTSIVNTLRRREGQLEAAIKNLESANATLELKDTEKSRYVLTVTHDIKGSLSSIQSCLRVVLDGLLGAVAEGIEDMVARAERRSLSLLRYVNELLYLSTLRAETGVSHQVVAPGEIFERVTREFDAKVGQKGIELTLTEETTGASVHVDPYGLEELYRQLLDNAVKYTSSGGKVTVHLDFRDDRGSLQLSVSDTGIGITAEDLPHLYEDFFSADIPENREASSTGLGLAIVKQIVTMHGGTIEVKSTPGTGSTFLCSIPVGIHPSNGGVG
ncbi:MAG: HAMP domain-containing histidine kinase [Spirochaetaceae bacterium]|nr:MAG: HAMP domain-containing histidine kinase [Spirochaetaceae bacterium]